MPTIASVTVNEHQISIRFRPKGLRMWRFTQPPFTFLSAVSDPQRHDFQIHADRTAITWSTLAQTFTVAQLLAIP
jgi:hypothetical protein